MLEPTCLALCCRGTGCSSSVGTYLSGIVLQGCSLFKACRNLPAGHCIAGKQAVLVVLEPNCLALCDRGEGYLNVVGTYLPDTVARVQAV